MRVCMISSSYPRHKDDGAGAYVGALASQLVSAGHEVHVIAPHDPLARSVPGTKVHVHRFHYAPCDALALAGHGRSLHADVKMKGAVPFLMVPYAWATVAVALRLHRREPFDIVHGHWAVPGGVLAAFFANLVRLPLVMTLHGSDVYVTEKSRACALFARYGYNKASCVTSVSGDLRERAIALGLDEARAIVVPSGVDSARFPGVSGVAMREELGLPASARVIVALGRLVHKKGFCHLIDAVTPIIRDSDDVYCVIGGDGDLRHTLSEQATWLGLDGRVLFPGAVPSSRAPEFIAMGEVVAVPSGIDSFGNVDGLPLVLLEAMAGARPVVASSVGGIPDALEDGKSGLLVPPGEPGALTEAILMLLDDREFAMRLADHAQVVARGEYDWSAIAARFVDIYALAKEQGA